MVQPGGGLTVEAASKSSWKITFASSQKPALAANVRSKQVNRFMALPQNLWVFLVQFKFFAISIA